MSIASQTAAAMAKTPGSPPETSATRAPLGRMVEGGFGALELLAVVGSVAALAGSPGHAVEIGPVAVEGVGLVEGEPRLLGKVSAHRRGRGRPRAAVRSRRPLPRRHQHDGEIGRGVVTSCRRAARSARPPSCRARHRPRRRAARVGNRTADLGEVPADLDHGDRVGPGEPGAERVRVERCRARRRARRRPCASGSPAADQQPERLVTPGITSVG